MKESITFQELKENLESFLQEVSHKGTSLQVKQKNGSNVMIIPEEEYTALEETAYLLRSPKNADRLYESMKDIERGIYQERELIEE